MIVCSPIICKITKKNARTQYARAHIDVELQKWSKNLLIVTL